jgi:hypothetical protein
LWLARWALVWVWVVWAGEGAEIESEIVAGHRGCTNRSDPIFDL